MNTLTLVRIREMYTCDWKLSCHNVSIVNRPWASLPAPKLRVNMSAFDDKNDMEKVRVSAM